MALTWGTYLAQLRRTVLRDKSKAIWTEDLELRDCLWWALDTFCAHTAVATSVEYTGVSDDSFELPDNLFESVETSGLVYLTTTGGSKVYLPPWNSSFTDRQNKVSYKEFPKGVLTLSDIPTGAPDLTVEYFAYYNHPYLESDTVDVPGWAVPALSYLIAANAMVGVGVTSANIGQWDDKTDAGQPEHNPLRRQHEWFLHLYESELARFPRQERMNYWKVIS